MTGKGGDSLAIARWLALLTLLLGMVVGTTFEVPRVGSGFAVAKDKGGGHGDSGNHGKGNANDDGDDDEGEGNGGDGNNQGNHGNGNKGDEKKDKKEKKQKDDDEAAPEPVQVVVVQPEAGYRVTVGCHVDAQSGQSTCVFAGVATAADQTVSGLAVSEGTVCASVVAGDFARSDGTSSAGDAGAASWYAVGSGYRGPAFVSHEQPDVVTLVLAGTVTTGGTATYWLRTAQGVQAAAGPGLRCEPAKTTSSTAKATGAIVVQGFSCPFAAGATDPAVDWFAACAQPQKTATYELTALDGDNAGWKRSETVGADGVLRADDLAPGHYRLVQVGADWCHAESDRVDDQGNVVVTAGARASVWIFDCTKGAAGTPAPQAK
ncbi:MAG TPA: hypothetical protein VH482_19910 [Thermomicrobiales bacterium]|jgi:hypothetical protein